ncbi:MAG TPA: hypothetical protein EYO51_05275 [Methylococcaceae bacterium]|jgi:hypothetical protein|nr:hypothetical protein [Methylococcaceae bacterium]HIN67768.1 hypothetical protein [Methylococcales bacterium]HIA44938.1 hypothetical protein [Methylococcaceae bacterium]HIB62544.1 hypothetical protein [Methylococcaceae bacterium]HIO13287.1 hypothetical protein [Methylococcales bacterium]
MGKDKQGTENDSLISADRIQKVKETFDKGRIDGDLSNTVSIDTNDDGRLDTVGVDMTGDGEIDTIIIDSNHDGRLDTIAEDTTGDGTFDSKLTIKKK